MSVIKFLVQGSAEDPYEIKFHKQDNKLIATCSCPAGENGMHCKHRISILTGHPNNLVSKNENDIPTVLEWLKGTSLEAALNVEMEAEREFIRADKAYAAAKKALAKIMLHPT